MNKNILLATAIMGLWLLQKNEADAQSCISTETKWCKAGNNGVVAGDWLGTFNNADLIFKTANIPRLAIIGTLGANIGFTGIGNTLNFTAQNLLHQHLQGNTTQYHQFTNGNTGITVTDGSLFGIEYRTATNPAVNYSLATIRQKENAPIYFYTTDSLRMVINENRSNMIYSPGSLPLNTNGFVGIAHSIWGQNFMRDYGPLSMLHLEGPNNFTYRGLGYRKWMRTGTIAQENSDFVYIGMKPEAYLASGTQNYNRSDAIIAWGDDLETYKDSTDNLRILFSGYAKPEGQCSNCYSDHQGYDAYEVARFTPPNTGFGPRFGVGNFYNPANYIPPARRLELLDMGYNLPQLRLTYTQSVVGLLTATGIYSDFRTTNLGNLYIHPATNGTNGFVGIHTTLPKNTLELNPLGSLNGTSPSFIPGQSGLRFNDLNNTSNAAIAGTYSKFLTVDGNGDVVLSEVPPSVGFCPTPGLVTNYLTKATANNVICNSIVYEYNDHDIGIGAPINNTQARLNVWADPLTNQQRSIYFQNIQTASNGIPKIGVEGNVAAKGTDNAFGAVIHAQTDNSYAFGIDVTAKTFNSNATAIGIKSYAIGEAIYASAGYFSSEGAVKNYGVEGYCTQSLFNNNTIESYGGFFSATGAIDVNYGVLSIATGGKYAHGLHSYANFGSLENFGIYTEAYNSGNSVLNYGIYSKGGSSCPPGSTACPDAAGYFNGDVLTTSDYLISDSILKKNVIIYDSALATISLLKPKEFDYKIANFPSMVLPLGKHFGLIAQDVELLLPQLVRKFTQPTVFDSLGNIVTAPVQYKAVNYIELIPILIAGIQEQQTQITNLQNQINSCCPNNSKGTNSSQTITTKLSDIETIILDQNEPNPFAEQTNINYFIPESAGKAEILFYTNDGRLINKVEIKEKGQGTLHIYASDLSTGIYTYTLMVSGKVVDTKKMMKGK